MAYRIQAVLILAALALPTTAIGSSEEKYAYFVEVEIELGKRTFVEEAGYDVVFGEVLEDTRCPADVECALPGNARIVLRFIPGMGPHYELELDTLQTLETEAFLFDGTGAELLHLEPLPTVEGNPAEYTVTVAIFELAE